VDPSLHEEEEEEEEEDRSFNEAARELEQLQMAFTVQNSLRDQQQGTRSTERTPPTSLI
jgi:hypothetical protein